ncbi:DUF3515 domain-containing protein [Streptomyces sp. ISL-44]|uniref:DUF3515 domain-containing protein n=1 Tax=unclassified Streptomyces TaxID=2593676 RepID=UPI001BE5A9E8|nr:MULTISPECIES: DUF3515 domain-containing protein [unclassified Streptomyces]MBT2546070.1 DUF3515 domain-containing protein [Streptomyces sp. ISL-44]MCX5011501.1 DUF3515 domain-containing protein [Streptomyces sp. NBC_00555]MCX5611989.1 DUF3515 domain-containing protein [Streptomyces sp. NBC_00047]UUU44544.1 DUF3515 domain-containing protein [Streptomyces sp. NBC_00162]
MSLHRRPRRVRFLPAVSAVLALAACSPGGSQARVDPPPTPPADVAGLCAALHEELPETVAGLGRTPTEPESGLTAAWGGSAIVLRCGIPKPPTMADPKQEGVHVNGVAWLLEQLPDSAGGGFRFTTGLRLAYTEVRVDKEHATDAGMLVGLSAAVSATVPEGISSY